MKLAAIWLLLTLLATLPTKAQVLPQGVRLKSTVGGITEYEFPNGLRVLLYPDSTNPKITVNVTYLVGSRHEGYGETGMAHLLEHMNFIQTTNGREIKKEIVDHGAQWNGTTSYDRTNYFETFPAGEQNLRWALGLEADRMVNVKMDKALLDVEMTVVRNEFERGENSPQRVLEERVVATAYLWHNYGKSTIGSREDIEKVPIERLAAFYKKFYQPDNAVIAIAGAIDPAKALMDVAATIGALPRPARKLEQTYTVEPVQDGERFVELRRVGSGQEIMIAYHAPAAAQSDAAALQVLSAIMSGGGGGFGGRGGGAGGGSGRLTKALVDNKKALNASMSFRPLHDPGFVMVSAALSADQSLDEARKIIFETIDGIVKEPPTKEEVDRAKTRLVRRLEQTMSDAQQVGMAMTTPVSQGDWRLMFYDHDRLSEVTPEDLVRVAKLYFKASNRTVGVFIPTAEPDRTVVPTTPDLDKLLKDIKSSVTIAQGEAFEPTPANIEKRMTRTTLANGMKVAVLPRRATGGNVSAVIEIHFGDESSLAGKSATSQMTAALLMRGTKTKTRQQIQDAMDQLNARITVGMGGGFGGRGGGGGGAGAAAVAGVSASIDVKAANFIPALKLAVEMLREPSFPERDFEQIQKQRIAGLENLGTDPGQLAALFLTRRLSPYPKGHPLYTGTQEEQAEAWKKVTLDDVKQFYAQFYGANHAEFVILGQIDSAEVMKAANELLGNWSSTAPYKSMRSSYSKIAGANEKIETPDKENAQFEAGLRIPLSDEDADYAAMLLANYMFGGSIAARMPNRIRNLEGLSYGASSRFTAPAEGDSASFTATVSSNPVNTPKVESSFIDELNKALKNGFTPEEVETAKKAYLDAVHVGRSQDQALLRMIAAREQRGRTMKWDEQFEARIQSLKAAQVNAAFRKYVDPSSLTIVKAGDFKKARAYGGN